MPARTLKNLERLTSQALPHEPGVQKSSFMAIGLAFELLNSGNSESTINRIYIAEFRMLFR